MFLYLSSVVPSIWLLEFDKLDRRLEEREGLNLTTAVYAANSTEELQAIQTFGVSIFVQDSKALYPYITSILTTVANPI